MPASLSVRTIETTQQNLVFSWQPEVIKHLIANNALTTDKIRNNRTETAHSFTRDLFLLAASDELSTGKSSSLARFARRIAGTQIHV